jgi:hypothetical protein
VAAYTFRDERDLLWYSTVFSAAEREGAYVIASSSCQAIHSAHTRSTLVQLMKKCGCAASSTTPVYRLQAYRTIFHAIVAQAPSCPSESFYARWTATPGPLQVQVLIGLRHGTSRFSQLFCIG